ncbi:MAG: hypothetical protein ACYC6N_15220 [Pirellulaceae bacterium]
MRFGIYVVQQGLVTAAQFAEAVSRQMEGRVSLGQLAMKSKMLSKSHVLHILAVQATEQRLFGKIALDLGYLSKEQLAELFLEQDEYLQPISKILVEMGALTQDEMEAELRKYRQYMADRMDPSGVLRTVV